ncbi:MAG: KilA-N domain-containing protein [Fusobacterium ulcerans]|uniref:KilA-N domain-containing protein n=1 Tax=Fusobacterium ulcerans TaxID=861 RepID=UPI003A84458E
MISEVSAEVGIPTSELILITKGGNNKNEQGTWIHEELILELASWLNMKLMQVLFKIHILNSIYKIKKLA